MLTFLGSDDEGLGGSVHQPAVAIDQVGHVLGNGQGRGCHCQRLKGEQTEKEPLLFSPQPEGQLRVTSDLWRPWRQESGSETGLSLGLREKGNLIFKTLFLDGDRRQTQTKTEASLTRRLTF